jgi:hypothetical protein
MTGIDLHAVPVRADEAVWYESEKDIVIRSASNGTAYSVQKVGADIWLVCDGEHSIGDILELLLVTYEIDRETLQKDLEIFLLDLQVKGLIELK